MHAKPGNPADKFRPTFSSTKVEGTAAADAAVSAAFSKALGGNAPRPHLAGAPGAKGKTPLPKTTTGERGGFDRLVPGKDHRAAQRAQVRP